MIRVLIADDDPAYREALVEVIRSCGSLELVGAARDAAEAVELARAGQPDVALFDTKMPAGGGPGAAREMRACSPRTRVLALSAHGDRKSVLDMLKAGAVGYLVKDAATAEIIAAIRYAASGEAVLSREVTAGVLGELSALLEQAEELNRKYDDLDTLKRELIQILSHELLTPLTVIQGTAQILARRGTELTPASSEVLVRGLVRATDRIKRLVGNVTTAALLDRHGVQIDFGPASATELVREAAAEFSGEDRVRLHPETDERAGAVVWAGAELAQRALVVVIENALAFSPPQEPVEVNVEADGTHVRVLVSDRGPGIPADLQTVLFQPFGQGDASTTRSHGGLGIGLYLAERVMAAHGGDIDAMARPGGGTIFILTFRRFLGDAGTAQPHGGEPSSAAGPARANSAGP